MIRMWLMLWHLINEFMLNAKEPMRMFFKSMLQQIEAVTMKYSFFAETRAHCEEDSYRNYLFFECFE